MNENASNGPATPGPEPSGGASVPSAQSRWGSIIKEVKTPLALLALLALICYGLVGYAFYEPNFMPGLDGTQKFYLIAGLIFIPIGILAIIGIYVIRGGTLGDEENKPGKKGRPLQPPKGLVVDDPPPQPDPVGEKPTPIQIVLNEFAKNPMIPSELPVMMMTAPDLVVRRVSRSAMRYFGYTSDAPTGAVVGKKVTELIKAMERFMDPPSAFWADLGRDQDRVINEVMDGLITYARVPVRLNDQHPEFPDKTFVPIITERRTLDETGDSRMILRVLYVDVAKLPKNLFTERVWEEVIEDLNPKELAQELREIKTVFDNRAFNDDKDKGETRRKALDDATQKLDQDAPPPSTLEDLSKAGWFELRETASKMQDKPRNIEELVNTILGAV